MSAEGEMGRQELFWEGKKQEEKRLEQLWQLLEGEAGAGVGPAAPAPIQSLGISCCFTPHINGNESTAEPRIWPG